jgi:hypothetical protein
MLANPGGRFLPLGTPGSGAVLYEHMFVSPTSPPLDPPGDVPTDRDRARESLALLAERTRPVSSSRTRLLPVLPPLVDLFPDGSLRRGSTIVIGDRGGTAGGHVSLALALLAATSGAGSWGALVGLPGLGAVAAHDIGIDLARLAVVPQPGAAWAEVTAALVDGVDVVVLFPPFPPRPAMARRLVARVRERRSVLVVVAGRSGWPEPSDLHLDVSDAGWDGVGAGEGYLHRRWMTVTAAGRRSAVRPRHLRLWLPGADGAVADATGDPAPPART